MATSFEPAAKMLSGSLGVFKYWWIVIAIAALVIVAVVIWWIKKYKQKNSQWTHQLTVLSELPNGTIDPKERIFKMRRWKHKTEITAPLFELEKPILGSRIFVELEQYSGPTSYTIVVGNDGRIYIPTKIIIDRDKNALQVSVKHAGIDRARQQYNNRFEQMNATPTKIDLLTLMKYGLWAGLLIVFLIVAITGFKSWGERAEFTAQSEQIKLQTLNTMQDVMITMESVINTQSLLIPDLKELYGNNIQGAIRNQKQELNES